MENLIELSLRGLKNVLSGDRPIINFNRLTTLKLDNCFVQVDIWPQFLRSVPTLENLQMIGVKLVGIIDDETRHLAANGLDWILPISMPHLKSLQIISMENRQFIYQCNKVFVDNLMGCQEIRRVRLSLDQKSTDEESMERLANMNIDLTVKALFVTDRIEDIRGALDSSSKFKVVRIFHERMKSFELIVTCKWSPELSTALENVTESCSNLTTFVLQILHKAYPSGATEIEPCEMKRINAAMLQLLGTWDRAMQLKELRLDRNFDEAVILAIFENCLNLDQLEISACPTVRDQHLIDWVSNGGGRLTHIKVFHCPNLTSEGIIQVLAKSAEGLLLYHIYVDQANGEERNWKTVIGNLCPNAKFW